MSVRLESASSESLSRTTGALNHNSPYTVCCAFYLSSNIGDYNHMIALGDQGEPDYANADFLGTDNDGVTLRCGALIATAGGAGTGSALTVGRWYHLALVRDSVTALKAYLDGSLNITRTNDITGRAAATIHRVGILNGLGANGRFAAWKEWAVALTADEIKQEMGAIRPVTHVFDAKPWYPMFPGASERTRDYSGNAYDWTENGTISDEDPPPLPWGELILPQAFSPAAAPASVTPRRRNPMRAHLAR